MMLVMLVYHARLWAIMSQLVAACCSLFVFQVSHFPLRNCTCIASLLACLSDSAGTSAVITAASVCGCSCQPLGSSCCSVLHRYKSSIGVKELMHFFNVTHTSINAASTMPSASPPQVSTNLEAPVTPMAPSTPTRFDLVGGLPAGRSRPGLRNFCKHGRREALRRTSCKRSRALSQKSSGRKRGSADNLSEADNTTMGNFAPNMLLQGSEVQATPTTSGLACAPCLAAEESSAGVPHAGTSEQAMMHQATAQPLHPKMSQHLEINVQLSSPALYKVC